MVPIVWSILSSFAILDWKTEELHHEFKFEQVHTVSKSVKYCFLVPLTWPKDFEEMSKLVMFSHVCECHQNPHISAVLLRVRAVTNVACQGSKHAFRAMRIFRNLKPIPCGPLVYSIQRALQWWIWDTHYDQGECISCMCVCLKRLWGFILTKRHCVRISGHLQ